MSVHHAVLLFLAGYAVLGAITVRFANRSARRLTARPTTGGR